MMNLQVGDFLLTQNPFASDNSSPGTWNHLGIYVGDGVVEAQVDQGVILTDLDTFIGRYNIIVVMRASNGTALAESARRLVGAGYRYVASVFKRLRRTRRGENCISVGRKAWAGAYGFDPGWQIPDNIYQDKRLTIVDSFQRMTYNVETN